MRRISIKAATTLTALFLTGQLTNAQAAMVPDVLPRPDGKPADMSKPVEVYILLGQSNMLGFGKTAGMAEGALDYAVKEKKLYPYLIDDAGNWTERKDVRNVRVMVGKGGGMQVFNNEWMTIKGNIGPEIGIGHYVGHVTDAPVMILKSCIGNRSLGWDLLPPGSEPYEFNGKAEPGYRGTPDSPKGTGEKPAAGWYAGKQYDDDIENAKKVLAELDKYYPGARGYVVKGFFWWQGDKDMRNPAHFTRYEHNLGVLMTALRKDFDAPDARFVFATLGQTVKGSKGGDGQILDAMFAVSEKNKGVAATVYANPLSKGGSSSGHYNKHAETYMNVGEGMGKAMAEMLVAGGSAKSGTAKPSAFARPEPAPVAPAVQRTWTSASGTQVEATLVTVRGADVILRKPDGATMLIGKEALSQADRDYLSGR